MNEAYFLALSLIYSKIIIMRRVSKKGDWENTERK